MLYQTKNRAGCAPRILGLTLLTISVMLAWSLQPAAAQDSRNIKVMTQNMDAGTDLGFILGWPDLVEGAQLTYQEITQSSIPERARRLAAEIAAAEPDLISLQEVTIWSLYSSTGLQVLYDQLNLLMDALAAHGKHYEVVATQPLTRAGAPLDYEGTQFLLFNDSDVILARAHGGSSDLHLSNVTMDRYSNLFTFGQFTELLGWISVDVEVHGKMIRLFNTHLVSPFSPEMVSIQIAQGTELISIMNASPYPVTLAGDFNSDASPLGEGPDLTPTAGNISAAGYTDVWQKLHVAPDYGLTWPRYLEDVYPIPASQVLATPTERIDLIFEKGLTPLNIKLIFDTKALLASDHMGVMATLRLDR